MSELKTYKLEDLGFLGRGKSRHRPRNDDSLFGGRYPFIQTGEVKAAEFYINSYEATYNEKGLEQSKLWNPGTLLITIAANIAETAILDMKACFPDSIIGFIPDEDKADVRYIKYYIDTIKLRMQNISKGTTQDNLSLEKLRSIDFEVPKVETQQKIASILSAFDDLIENNTRRLAILEEMARLIYREWFVHYRYPGAQGSGEQATPGNENDFLVDSGTELGEVPEGWELKNLEDVADLNPENISKDFKGEIEYINISGVDTGKINETELYDIDDAPGRAKRKVNHGDIIWSSVRPNLKSYAMIMNPKPNWIASTGFAVIRPLKLPSSFLYNFVTTDYFVEYLINHARGSAYPAVNVSDFKNAKIVVPPDDLVKKYDDLVWSNFQQIDRLERKNKKLKETRDLLLPKLISGRVGYE